ncbi:class I SAM-dependent methyltransferase [Mastigocoleus testarum]|uniref:Methyltransferase type 11 n=1 Tax=Mastigocoleus testarum BC008 TaxID=371196 RepID=A0A0V7ZCX7_9CYAN|nr:class I SAM-dependent methyltransferase [Mastigocoleus testarum]KST62393.1 methyltransferase type 11 [Mastigocoleus testarum BC008]
MHNLNNLESTKKLYDLTASSWVREKPSSLSDFTARPFILDMCEPLKGRKVLDLGCGEGYCTRELSKRGAAQVYGIDISENMIRAAKQQEEKKPLNISYENACATNLKQFGDNSFDLVVAVFLFNYLNNTQMKQCMSEVARILRPAGQFIFSIPHPCFPYMRDAEYPFYFEVNDKGYFSQRDRQFTGKIWKIDGVSLDVQLIHKTFEDYFDALRDTGFEKMPILKELRVTPEMIALDPSFFSPIADFPLHAVIKISK